MDDRSTIYDVAREAGVAASTVSRAYARPGRVSAQTARAVFAAAERIGYRATRITGPTGPHTGALALMVSDITNPYYAEIIKGAEYAARAAGYSLLLSDTSESGPVERDTVERALGLVEGVVLASPRMSDSSIRTIAKQKPLVLLNRRLPEASCIVADNRHGVRSAVEHLRVLGHDALTYVAGPAASWTEGERWRALRDTGHELAVGVRRIDPRAAPTMLTGLALARQIAQSNATAVLAYNDVLAIGIIAGLRQVGVRVPADVSVIGFDNVALTEVVDPALTTIVAPLRRAGTAGVDTVLALAAGSRTSGGTLVLPVKLMVRASTGPRPAHRRRNSTSPARGTTMVSESAVTSAGSRDSGSR